MFVIPTMIVSIGLGTVTILKFFPFNLINEPEPINLDSPTPTIPNCTKIFLRKLCEQKAS